MATKRLIAAFLLLTAALMTGCQKGEDSDGGSSGQEGLPPFRTNCGTVIDSSLENPVDPEGGTRGMVRVVGPNLLIMTPDTGGDILIKLHGLGAPYSAAQQSGAQRLLTTLAAEKAIFFPPDVTCTTAVDSATAMVGQVFTVSGKSYSETLIESGYGVVEEDVCESSLITSCYSAMIEEASKYSAGELEAFLWKPVSDSNGKLAIHSSPEDTVVAVNGESGDDFSGGNGYDNLTRFSKPGCSYGQNVKVRVTNSQGVPYKINGETQLTIPDGCQRYCLRNGSLTPCPKR